MSGEGRSYCGVNVGKVQPGMPPWICKSGRCYEALLPDAPEPAACPRCGGEMRRAGPYLVAHPRENVFVDGVCAAAVSTEEDQ